MHTRQPRHRRHRPEPLPVDAPTLQPPPQIQHFRQVEWEQHVNLLNMAQSPDDCRRHLDALVDIWSERAGRQLVFQAGLQWHKRFRQRGNVQPVRSTTATPQVRQCDLDSFEVSRQDAVLQRAEASPGPQKQHTWDTCKRALQWLGLRFQEPLHLSAAIPDVAELDQYDDWLKKHIAKESGRKHRELVNKARKQRVGKAAHRYVTKPYRPIPTHVDGTCDTEAVEHRVRNYVAGYMAM